MSKGPQNVCEVAFEIIYTIDLMTFFENLVRYLLMHSPVHLYFKLLRIIEYLPSTYIRYIPYNDTMSYMFRSSHFLFWVPFGDKVTKIRKYYVIFAYILQGKDGQDRKNPERKSRN